MTERIRNLFYFIVLAFGALIGLIGFKQTGVKIIMWAAKKD